MRNLLTYAAIDEPDPPAGQEFNQSGAGGSLAIYGYPEVEIPRNVYWKIHDGDDRWRFWFAHPGGQRALFLDSWAIHILAVLIHDGAPLPGNRSDKLVSNGSYRTDVGIL